MITSIGSRLGLLLLVLANNGICYKSTFSSFQSEPQIDQFEGGSWLGGPPDLGGRSDSIVSMNDDYNNNGEDVGGPDSGEFNNNGEDDGAPIERRRGSGLAGRAIHPIPDHCNTHDGQPIECRRNHCFYNCHVKECNSRSVNFCSQYGCDQFCGDPCGCKKNKCSYELTSNLCRKGHRACSLYFLEGIKCATKGSFYSKMGIICRNDFDDLNEDDDHSCTPNHIYGVNINGGAVADDEGRVYQEDSKSKYKDIHKIRKENAKSVSIDGVSGEAKKLYQSWIVATDSKRQVGRCVSYDIPLEGDGFYEVCVNMAEYKYTQSGKRAFNIRFNSLLIGHEVDIFELAKSKNHGIELCFGYEISGDEAELAVHGFPATLLSNKHVTKLSFCYSRCREIPDGGFSVSAFRVTRWEA